MCEDLIAGGQIAGCRSDGRDDSGRLHPKRHRRRGANVPSTAANVVVPVPDPGCPDLDEDLAGGELTRIGHINGLDGGTERADPGHAHVRNGKRLAT